MNTRDRAVLKVVDLLMKLATRQTRARVLVAMYGAQGRLVPDELMKRAGWPLVERVP